MVKVTSRVAKPGDAAYKRGVTIFCNPPQAWIDAYHRGKNLKLSKDQLIQNISKYETEFDLCSLKKTSKINLVELLKLLRHRN